MQLRTLLLLPLLAVVFCACHRHQVAAPPQPLAATVPAHARVIAKSDLDAALKMADCRSHAGKIQLTPELRRLLARWPGLPLLEAAANAGDRLNLTEAYWIDLGEGFEPVLTALLRQPIDDQEEMQTDSLPGGIALLSDGRQAWLSMADAQALALTVDTIRTRAKERNMLSAQSIESEFFSQPSTLSAMAKGENVINPLGDAFDAVCVRVDVRDRAISAQARFASAGAWVDATSLMLPIDAEAALSDLPPGCVMVAAGGATVASICRLLSAIPGLPFDSRFTLSLYARMLAVNGTISLAAAPGGRAETIRDFSLRHWDCRLNIPLESDPVKALDFADSYLPEYLYVVADSQFLYASTYEPGSYDAYSDYSPEIAPTSRLALMARIPYRSETMKALRLRAGYSIDIQADSSVTLNLRVLGPADYILPTLISDL